MMNFENFCMMAVMIFLAVNILCLPFALITLKKIEHVKFPSLAEKARVRNNILGLWASSIYYYFKYLKPKK